MRIRLSPDFPDTQRKLELFADVLADGSGLMGSLVDAEREWQREFAEAEGNRRWRRLKRSTQKLKQQRGQPPTRRGYATGALFRAMTTRGAFGAYSWVGGRQARVGTNLAYSKWFDRNRRLIPPSNQQHRAYLAEEAVAWLENHARTCGYTGLVEDWMAR